MKAYKKHSFKEESFYEYHESHYESTVPEPVEGGTSQTFLDWYESHLHNFNLQGDIFQAHILKESYYKILNYKINLQCSGYTLTDHQLILQCNKLHHLFLHTCTSSSLIKNR